MYDTSALPNFLYASQLLPSGNRKLSSKQTSSHKTEMIFPRSSISFLLYAKVEACILYEFQHLANYTQFLPSSKLYYIAMNVPIR